MGRVKTSADIDAQIEQLKAKKAALLQKERASERKKRNHAMMVFGGLVEKYYGDGDWTAIDPAKLEEYMQQFAYAAVKRVKRKEQASADEANEKLRAWERSGREKKD